MLLSITALLAGCADTIHKSCSWVGPGGRAVYVCK